MASGTDQLMMLGALDPGGGLFGFGGSGFEKHDPFSLFSGARLPATAYQGAPTDAYGRPIASYQAPVVPSPAPAAAPGVTLASNPANPAMDPANLAWILKPPPLTYSAGGGRGGTYTALDTGGLRDWQNAVYGTMMRQQQQPAAAPQAETPPYGAQNYQAALSALSNPGKVVTPGSPVAPGPAYQPSGGTLDRMLQTWAAANPVTLNTNFVNTLRGLRGG